MTQIYEMVSKTIYDDNDQKRIHLIIQKMVKGKLKLVYDKYFTEQQYEALDHKKLPQPDYLY